MTRPCSDNEEMKTIVEHKTMSVQRLKLFVQGSYAGGVASLESMLLLMVGIKL